MTNSISDIALSIVTPVYQAGSFIDDFYKRITAMAADLTPSYEIIFVNDGSTDQSLKKLVAIQKTDPHVTIIDLTRNYGQHPAMRAGLSQSKGDRVFVLDCDPEENTGWLQLFAKTMQDASADVVYSRQSKRRGNLIKQLEAKLFYGVLALCAETKFTRDIMTPRLMTRRYVNAVLSFPERHFELSIIGHLAGFSSVTIPLQKTHRKGSTYTFARRLAFCMAYFPSATTRPLTWIMPAALVLLICAAGATQPLHAVIFACSGAIMFALGIIAIYLKRVLEEVRRRPVTLVKQIYPGHD